MDRPADKENLWINLDAELKRELVAYSEGHKKTPLTQCGRAGIELFMALPDPLKAVLLNLDRRSDLFKQVASVAAQALVRVTLPPDESSATAAVAETLQDVEERLKGRGRKRRRKTEAG